MSSSTITQLRHQPCTPSRAARELGLKRSEFDLAVHLGRIRTVPDEGGGGRHVPRSELDRLRATAGFPDALRQRLRLVGTTEGAEVMEIPVGRFTRLARLGLFSPVRFYLNRYRAVVWLYLADELEEFTTVEENTPLLTARRMPEGLRDLLDEGVDLRARNWRGRHRGFLLRLAEDPWESAGALAAFLDPVRIAELVPDPYERSHLSRFRPGPPGHGAQGSPAALLVEKIMTADDPAEIDWLGTELTRALEDARHFRPAPRPSARPAPPALPQNEPAPPEPSRGLLGRLWRRSG
ncbi:MULTISPECIES: DUF6397 family protein [unclassified Streptomyces]|jgi:hypothetical protein|uniref:DUF6397 family protein n=1 Tax=unclassified Streptomyces TaxID=2593676 RepID=UPI000F4E59F6|nr:MULTISPECIES: DUF6397 family protein [unclassified Streptomyces]MDH6448011.1 hypothetical protein [Streptomyces sp. SAI-119]MDH6501267.1 hypothetical protein [Streptomyces sp. SAI-149]QUC60281.1 hypothetical protein IOD14_27960 [Streptomyces sp. A2-16]